MAADPDIAKLYEFHINKEQEKWYHIDDDKHLRKLGLVFKSLQVNAGLEAFDEDGCVVQWGIEKLGAYEDSIWRG
jgi:hypothetical protein